MSHLRQLQRIPPAWWLGVALSLMLAFAVQMGAMPVHLNDWLDLPKMFDWSVQDKPTQTLSAGTHVLFNLRVPRLLLAVLVGASLGLSGALTQSLFRNPLA